MPGPAVVNPDVPAKTESIVPPQALVVMLGEPPASVIVLPAIVYAWFWNVIPPKVMPVPKLTV